MKLSRFVARSRIARPAAELYAWHMNPGALDRLTPPWDRVRIVERAPEIRDGARTVLEIGSGPFRSRWVAVHDGLEPGRQFRDTQRSGPMRSWVHTHRFSPAAGGSVLEDAIDYALPLGFFGHWLGRRFVERKLRRTFAYRHAVTRADVERHAELAGPRPLHVAISGAGGLVGSALAAYLSAGGHRVSRLVRGEPRDPEREILFDPVGGRIGTEALATADAVVHLAGENIAAGRWSQARMRRIRASRVEGTRLIAETLAALGRPPRTLISASAIGFYGDRGDERLDENSSPGDGFLPETCFAWEAASAAAESAGVRVVRLRIGVVVAAAGGALPRMLLPFRLGLGGRIGSGRQFVSWIALDDLIGVMHHALVREELAGAVNAVAPNPVRNADFTRQLAHVLRRPALVPVPAAVVRLALGRMGRDLLLASSRVEPQRLAQAGFRFRQPRLGQALRFELGRFAADRAPAEFETRGRC